MRPAVPIPAPVSTRKKAAAFGVRAWLAVDVTGAGRVLEAGRHAIMRRTGLPARDLRILDPLLSYPSTVLGRERAVVVNLEHIKAIVTAQEVLVLNARDPSVQPFVHELQRRLQRRHASLEPPEAGQGAPEDCFWSNSDRMDMDMDMESQLPARENRYHSHSGGLHGDDNRENQESKTGSSMKVLPFEFVALETCLEAACSSLENETSTLEQEAHPALDKLTSKISTLNLERVRQIKSRLVDITGRVQKVRDELEHLLDDDEDMAEMYLTDKLQNKGLDDESSTHSSYNVMGDTDDHADQGSQAPSSLEGNDVNSICDDELPGPDSEGIFMSGSQVFGNSSSTIRSGSKHHDVDELEMLLEAYFVHIDGTLNKLSTLREYVDDTEDYINIMLDDKQNQLLQMGVVLTTATLIVSAFVALVGIFGMNIKVDLFDEKKSGTNEFLWTVGGGAAGSVFLYVVATSWCKHRRLLE